MNRRVDEVRKRIAKRKHTQLKMNNESLPVEGPIIQNTINNKEYPTFEEEERNLTSFGMRTFFLKVLASVILVVGVAEIFQNNTQMTQQAQSFVKRTMEKEFQFAKVSKWYEEKFGAPLTFLSKEEKKSDNPSEYAIPASGKVLENFQTNGQGVLVETETNAKVEAIDEGVVTFVGEKEQIGNAIVVQHADGSESWYGNLKDISVNVYDSVKKGETIAKVSNKENEDTGTYYLAIKKDDAFIDPSKVIPFE